MEVPLEDLAERCDAVAGFPVWTGQKTAAYPKRAACGHKKGKFENSCCIV